MFLIKHFRNRNAPIHGGITNSAIKYLLIQCAIHVANVIKEILHFQQFHSSCEQGDIVPINKPGDAAGQRVTDPPVSFLS